MDFKIEAANALDFPDSELSELLNDVYVGDGYVGAELAETLFDATSVRSRGRIITASNTESKCLAGLVIMVPPSSNARKFAKDDEVEVHLLAVKKEFRNQNLGSKLVRELILKSQEEGYKRIILWTQESMKSAQNLYTKMGFVHESNFKANGRDFYLYHRAVSKGKDYR